MQQRAHTESNLANLLIEELAGEQTSPQMLLSTPYERVDIVEMPAPELRQTRRRAATIPREDLLRRAKARDEAETFDAASTMRFSAPYARIEVGELESIVRASGSFEAWFKDDVQAEPTESHASDRWLWFLAAAMLTAFAVTVVALL